MEALCDECSWDTAASDSRRAGYDRIRFSERGKPMRRMMLAFTVKRTMSLLRESEDRSSMASFSECGKYRYVLGRRWRPDGGIVAFVSLNPSTADETRDDPTVRRLIGFAKRWGYGGLRVVNVFAYRATQPTAILQADDPVGAENDGEIAGACREADRVVVCWGNHGEWFGRAAQVRQLLLDSGFRLWCFGRTQHGHPKHPLYLPASTRLRRC